MVRKLIFVVLCSLILSELLAQNVNVKKTFRNGVYYIEIGFFENALENFLQLYESDPSNSNYCYLVGKSYFNIPPKREEAKPYLAKALSSISSDYKTKDPYNSDAHPEVYAMLGELFHVDDELDSALFYYKKYADAVSSEKEKEKAEHHLNTIKWARKLQESYLPFSAQNLGSSINTEYSDYNPVLSADEQTMAYTSFQNNSDEIFVTKRENGKWGTPLNITKQIGSNGQCFTTALSFGGDTLYLIRIDEYGTDIFFSEFDGRKWTRMKSFDSRINTFYYETSFYINDKGDEVYFSSDSPDGVGGIDLYYSKLDDKGKWGHPVNLGPRINTPYDEEHPFLASNGEILFFSSTGHETMGGFDIFFSQKLEDGIWTKPINLGYPVNTTGNDISYIALEEGNRGYIAKDLPGGYGLVDIYEVEIPRDLLFADKLIDKPAPEKLLAENTENVKPEIPAQYIEEPVDVVESMPETSNNSADEEVPEEIVLVEETRMEETNTSDMRPAPKPDPAESSMAEEFKETTIEKTLTAEKTSKETVASVPSPPSPRKNTENKPITAGVFSERSKPANHSVHYKKKDLAFTIQIIALKKPVPVEKFNNAGKVKRSDGDDLFTRYTVGYFKDVHKAKEELSRINKVGYTGAFIRDVRTVSNYFASE